jgi:putative endonuclease
MQAYRWGRFAESLCSLFLRVKGYQILARNHREKVGEIDIIARRASVLAFVEVKARGSLTDAAESLGSKQRQRIVRAAQMFVAKNPPLAELDQRFDVILVLPWGFPAHLTDAWRPDIGRTNF